MQQVSRKMFSFAVAAPSRRQPHQGRFFIPRWLSGPIKLIPGGVFDGLCLITGECSMFCVWSPGSVRCSMSYPRGVFNVQSPGSTRWSVFIFPQGVFNVLCLSFSRGVLVVLCLSFPGSVRCYVSLFPSGSVKCVYLSSGIVWCSVSIFLPRIVSCSMSIFPGEC